MEVLAVLIMYLIPFSFACFVLFFVIKSAVKAAIYESLKEIKKVIRD